MIKDLIKTISNRHISTNEVDNIVIASAPRSGSTWLMELIWTQPSFKICNEPLNVRIKSVAKGLAINNFEELYQRASEPLIFNYFSKIAHGKMGFLNPSPFRKDWKFSTSRIVYKVINDAEHLFDQITKQINAQLVFLVRHPFSVYLRRKVLPRLTILCDFIAKAHFSQEQIDFAKRIHDHGSFMEKAVLSWTLQNAIFLKYTKSNYIFITYEELVINPNESVAMLAQKLNLPQPNLMIKRLKVPSAVTVQSDKGTKEAIAENNNSEDLCTRWKAKLSDHEIDNLWAILECFELDKIYNKKTGLPTEKFTLAKGKI